MSPLQAEQAMPLSDGATAKTQLGGGVKGKIARIPTSAQLSQMLLKSGRNGLAAKLLAKQSPALAQRLADHSTFGALNLDAVAVPRAAMARTAGTPPTFKTASTPPSGPEAEKPTPLGAHAVAGSALGLPAVREEVDHDEGDLEEASTAASTAAMSADEMQAAVLEAPDSFGEGQGHAEVRRLLLSFRTFAGGAPAELKGFGAVEHLPEAFLLAETPRSSSKPLLRRLSGADLAAQGSRTPLQQGATTLKRGSSGSGSLSMMQESAPPTPPSSKIGSALRFQPRVVVPRGPLEELKRSVRSLLNKACPENMTPITERLSALQVSSGQELQQVVGLLFQKALSEPHYCETYADLILALRTAYPEFPANDGASRPITFRSSLLDVCQQEFEALPSTLEEPLCEDGMERDAEELELSRQKRKGRMLANMKLIGHLFLRQLLPPKVIVHVIEELLFRHKEGEAPAEHAVECACELIIATGHAIDAIADGKKFLVRACGRLTELKGLKNAKGTSTYSRRLQFLVQDLLDARAAGWVQRTFRERAQTKVEILQGQERELQDKLAQGGKGKLDDRRLSPSCTKRQPPRYSSTIVGA